jgi:hypothetical protein
VAWGGYAPSLEGINGCSGRREKQPTLGSVEEEEKNSQHFG